MSLIKVVLMEDKEEVLNSEMQDAEVPTLTKRRSKANKNEFNETVICIYTKGQRE